MGSIAVSDFISQLQPRQLVPSAQKLPRISVIIPSYNTGKFLERTLLSILNQDYPNTQVILVDGGSTDNTRDVINKYRDYIDYWVSEKDNGQADAINKGISKVTGELVGWQNADDLYLPRAFQEIARLYNTDPQAVLYCGNVMLIDAQDRVLGTIKGGRPTFERLLIDGYVISSQGVFWPKATQEAVGLYNAQFHYAMDAEFWLRCLSRGRAAFTHEYIGAFRVHPNTKTSTAGRTCGVVEYRKLQACYGIDEKTILFKARKLLMRSLRIAVHLWAISRRGRGIR